MLGLISRDMLMRRVAGNEVRHAAERGVGPKCAWLGAGGWWQLNPKPTTPPWLCCAERCGVPEQQHILSTMSPRCREN